MEALWLSAIGEYGFPIVITFYLLYRIEKKLDNLNQSVLLLQTVCPFDYSKYSLENNPISVDDVDQNNSKNSENPLKSDIEARLRQVR